MLVLKSYVRFTSSMNLPTVASVLSKNIFGGVPFVQTDEFDEVPGVRLERPVLMLSASICGEGPEFGLRIQTVLPIFGPGKFPKLLFQGIDGYIMQCLASHNDIQFVHA